MQHRNPNKRLVLFIILLIVVALGGAAGWYVWTTKKPTAQPQVAQQNQAPTTQQKSPAIVTLAPGITVPRGAHDTTDPTDTWVLVSKTRPLKDVNYAPTVQKVTVAVRADKSADELSLRPDIMTPVNDLFAAAKTAGYDFMLSSGYRSKSLQQTYYQNYVAASGEEAANKFSAKPGQSEHQTGLGFDMNLTSRECYLETCLGELPAGKWLAAHAYEYGFIVRYPQGKEAITGYQYEPWHLRYVGSELAAALYKSGLTLDEAITKIDAVAID